MLTNNHEKLNYYPLFDWLRLILALTVCFYHSGIFGWVQSGNFAVQVFFALSGWLIGSILLSTSKIDLPRFYFNRALRIWVPYFFALLLLVVASLLHDPITPKWFEIIFYKISFVYNLFAPQQLDLYRNLFPLQGTGNHFWSVNAEEQFYLLSPLLLVLAPARIGKSVWVWVGISLLALFTKNYASIVLGVLSAVIVKEYGDIHLSIVVRLILISTIILSFIGFTMQYDYLLIAPLCSISIVMLLASKGEKNTLGSFAGGIS